MDIRKKVGLRIKEFREAKGFSQKDIAYASELDRTYIASVENGKRNISIVNIEKIAQALSVSIKTFFDDKIFSDL